MEGPTKVVVIGLGLAGSACAASLDSIAKTTPISVTIVDVRETSISKYAGCRAAALGESYAYRVTIPNKAILRPSTGKVIHKLVTEIRHEVKEVVFSDRTSIKYDILICASGARNVSPCEPPLEATTFQKQVAYFEVTSSKIKESQHITVLGSGAVGTELAGEIQSAYPDKTVAILSPGPVLVDGMRHPPPKKFYDRVEKITKKMGMDLYLDQRPVNMRLTEFEGNSYLKGRREILTDNGTKFETDLVLLCTGKRLNNTFYPPDWLDENGHIEVKGNLQTVFDDSVFAIGDINNVDETKQGYFAQKQARVCAKNIEALLKNRKMKEYKPLTVTQILIPLGRNIGVSYLGGVILGSIITSRIKGKDLMIKDHWALYKVKNLLINENDSTWLATASRTYAAANRAKTSSGLFNGIAMPTLRKKKGTGSRKQSKSRGSVFKPGGFAQSISSTGLTLLKRHPKENDEVGLAKAGSSSGLLQQENTNQPDYLQPGLQALEQYREQAVSGKIMDEEDDEEEDVFGTFKETDQNNRSGVGFGAAGFSAPAPGSGSGFGLGAAGHSAPASAFGSHRRIGDTRNFGKKSENKSDRRTDSPPSSRRGRKGESPYSG